MTAVVIATQRNTGCVSVATDAAIYTPDQVVRCFGTKVFPVAHWPGLITTVGNAAMTPLFGARLAQRFRTFDALVDGVEGVLPDLVREYDLPSGADLLIAGVSEDRGPEAYACRTDDSLPLTATAEEAAASDFWADEPFTLIKLPDLVMTPVPSDQVVPANYTGVDLDADAESVLWSIRKILEMQRHMELPAGIGAIGGWAQCVTISRAGIGARMLQEWQEDDVGALLRPAPIDWTQWHRDNPKPVAAAPLQPAMSRVRRDVLARKARKLQLVS